MKCQKCNTKLTPSGNGEFICSECEEEYFLIRSRNQTGTDDKWFLLPENRRGEIMKEISGIPEGAAEVQINE